MSEPRTTEPTSRRHDGVGRTVVHVIAVAGGSAARWFTRSTRAEGADASGLASLIDLHAIQSAGDALLTVALANTLFFSVSVDQARSKVALYLLITMAPFAVIAPIIGPLLDRFRNGRRYALAATLILRAFLAWVMAGAVGKHGGFALYPAAFGALVCSKAYGVSRSAVVPRVLPPNVTLVRGNSRLTLWGVLTATVAAPIGQGLSWATGTPSWTLRLCARRLPRRQRVRVQAARAGRFERGRSPAAPTAATGESAASIRRRRAARCGALDVPPDPASASRHRATNDHDAASQRRPAGIHRVPDPFPCVPDSQAPARRLRPRGRPRHHRRLRRDRQRARDDAWWVAETSPTRAPGDRQPLRGIDHGSRRPLSGSTLRQLRWRSWSPTSASRCRSSASTP